MPTTRSSNKPRTQNKNELHASSSKIPPKTPGGHYIIVNGRKWRAKDPNIPDEALRELKHYLAKGRSGVRKRNQEKDDTEKINLARRTTALAKLGLGERGKPEWWNDTDENRKQRWESSLASLRELHNS
ncbi:hypothetical protein QBC42DRAFT_258414 [Cladorrhinum samala]|uniref:Uncharacterized protein n=1 Tax=Cladorrhinum samala TaxID=585594 RepID=A0AAV9I1Q7_9PEZI|nr:hypothetical protein QBC42DRAFT_258414 [Cladorrhinum samala]